jgi:hypothetical protein
VFPSNRPGGSTHQSLAGIISNAQAELRWLRRGQPDLKVDRLARALAKEEVQQEEKLRLNLMIEETLLLLRILN